MVELDEQRGVSRCPPTEAEGGSSLAILGLAIFLVADGRDLERWPPTSPRPRRPSGPAATRTPPSLAAEEVAQRLLGRALAPAEGPGRDGPGALSRRARLARGRPPPAPRQRGPAAARPRRLPHQRPRGRGRRRPRGDRGPDPGRPLRGTPRPKGGSCSAATTWPGGSTPARSSTSATTSPSSRSPTSSRPTSPPPNWPSTSRTRPSPPPPWPRPPRPRSRTPTIIICWPGPSTTTTAPAPRRRLDEALKINPKHVDSLLLRAVAPDRRRAVRRGRRAAQAGLRDQPAGAPGLGLPGGPRPPPDPPRRRGRGPEDRPRPLGDEPRGRPPDRPRAVQQVPLRRGVRATRGRPSRSTPTTCPPRSSSARTCSGSAARTRAGSWPPRSSRPTATTSWPTT